MPRLSVGDTQLDYEDTGSGHPLLFVHGSANDRRTWRVQQDAFAHSFRVITYSRRYHWPNRPIPEGAPYSMAQQLDDLETVLVRLRVTPVHLVGHSYGAFLSLLLAMRDPSLLRTLVLAEPPAITLFIDGDPSLIRVITLLLTRPRPGLAIVRFMVRGVLPAMRAFRQGDMQRGIEQFADAVFGSLGYGGLTDDQRQRAADNLSTVKAEILGPGFLSLPAERMKEIRIPTLLLTGEDSIGLFHHITDRLEDLIPITERKVIRQASHIVHEDNPAAFNESVLTFLKKHEESG